MRSFVAEWRRLRSFKTCCMVFVSPAERESAHVIVCIRCQCQSINLKNPWSIINLIVSFTPISKTLYYLIGKFSEAMTAYHDAFKKKREEEIKRMVDKTRKSPLNRLEKPWGRKPVSYTSMILDLSISHLGTIIPNHLLNTRLHSPSRIMSQRFLGSSSFRSSFQRIIGGQILVNDLNTLSVPGSFFFLNFFHNVSDVFGEFEDGEFVGVTQVDLEERRPAMIIRTRSRGHPPKTLRRNSQAWSHHCSSTRSYHQQDHERTIQPNKIP